MRIRSCFVLALVGVTILARAEPSHNMDLLQRTSGMCYSVAMLDSGVAATGFGGVLTLWDVTDPYNPQALSTTMLEGNVTDLFARESWLYMANGYFGVAVLDVEDAQAPRAVAHLPLEGWVSGLAAHDSLLFVASQQPDRLTIVDVSDPELPVQVSQIAAGSWNGRVAIAPEQDIAYMLSNWNGYAPVDISQPDQPVELGWVQDQIGHLALAFADGFALMARDSHGLTALELGDPMEPEILGSLGLPSVRDVTMTGDLALVACGESGLHVVDAGTPDGLLSLGMASLSATGFPFAMDVEAQDSLAVVATQVGASLVEYGDPQQPAEVASLGHVSRGLIALQRRDDLLFALESGGNLRVYQVDPAAGLLPLQDYTVPPNLVDMDVAGPWIALLGENGTLLTGQVDEQGGINLMGNLALPETAAVQRLELDSQRGLLHVSTLQQGVFVVDVLDPATPTQVGNIDVCSTTCSVAMRENLMAVGCDGTVSLVDLSNPGSPDVLSALPLGGMVLSLAFDDGFLLAAVAEEGVHAIDITDPAQPQATCFHPLTGLPFDMRLHRNHLVIVDSFSPMNPASLFTQVRVLEGWRQGSLQEVAWWTLDSFVGWVAPGPEDIVVGGNVDGLLLLRLDESLDVDQPGGTRQPRGFHLLEAAPNPFNPTTTIRFRTSGAGPVKLEVFDLVGRRVRLLEDAMLGAGTHSRVFEAGKLASGVYVVRLEADGRRQANRVLLLK